ncbi:hypothetical protein PG997_010950 [Apiospora hydei]|uniref:Uncharacterized protein n=1 Tax=Apiospora hydei TaxID=1337664 RepID=A0ABR1VIN6_9PEZI
MPGSYRITNLLYQGFASDMSWETRPEWDPQRNASICRKLLENGDMDKLHRSLRKCLKLPDNARLRSLKKPVIDEHFGLLYEYASHNVKECAKLDPVRFFAAVKEPFAWAGPIDPEHLWKFTYRALMARDNFLKNQAGAENSPGYSMVKYLDAYKRAFFLDLPPAPGQLAKPRGGHLHQHATGRDLPRHGALLSPELTCAGGQGDGTDRLVVVDPSRATSAGHVRRNNNKPVDSSDEDSEDDEEEKQKAADAEE